MIYSVRVFGAWTLRDHNQSMRNRVAASFLYQGDQTFRLKKTNLAQMFSPHYDKLNPDHRVDERNCAIEIIL